MDAADWSLLLPELLHSICTKLTDIADFIRFRAVCKAWRLSVSLSDPSPHLPWIQIYRQSHKIEDLQFYSLFSNKTHTIDVRHVPELSGASIIGTTRSSLLICKGSEKSLSLLNPLVTNEISLPLLKREMEHPVPDESAVWNPVISSNGQTMILGLNRSETLSLVVSRPGDGFWSLTKLRATCGSHVAWTYYNDMYFVCPGSNKQTMVIDAITGDVVSTIPDLKMRNNGEVIDYLVESGGKLLRIFINNCRSRDRLSLDVYVLDVQEKGYRWLEIKDINNHILFLDISGGFSLTSSEFQGLRGNCIYFFSHYVKTNDNEERRCLLHRYELVNNSIEILPYPFRGCGRWIVPSLC
ncbi:F-box domain-containing protein [Rhynchospora pubera]|uniref:F-box domain-containing protein n=1 Tax=Rhynchospora pubera TaxID=906938 RepID=A0AAV8DZI8_9POAL|nr:F-box domain-containing protein [Rhynchospora pubera]